MIQTEFGMGMLLGDHNKKTWRLVVDGNGDHRLQYSFQSGAQAGPTSWHWDERKFKSESEARLAIGEMVVARIIGEL